MSVIAGIGLKLLTVIIVVNFMFYMVGGADGVWGGYGMQNDTMAEGMGISYDRDDPSGNVTANTQDDFGLNNTGLQSSSSLFGVDSTWGRVYGFFKSIFNFFYAPYHVLNAVGAPSFMSYLFLSLWTIIYLTAIAQFIWRGTF